MPPSGQDLIQRSARLTIADPKGSSYGSGTLIDSRGGEALVLTCGHIFRDSQGKGQISVDLFGSQAAETHHSRWFLHHLPADGSVRFETLGLSLVGLSLAGPHARDVLQKVTDTDLASTAFRFMDFRRMDLGMIPALFVRRARSGPPQARAAAAAD